MKKNIIYGLKDPITNDYKYIGKSTSGLQRPLRHLVKSNNEKVNEWVAALRKEELIPDIDILEEVDNPNDLLAKECYWIGIFKDDLFNENSIHKVDIRISKLEKQLLIREQILKAKLEQTENALRNIEDLGKLIKERRKLLRLTQEDASEMCGISKRTIQLIEKNNSNFTLKTIQNYLNLLGLKLVPSIKSTPNVTV